MSTHILAEELAPLQAQIGQVRGRLEALEGELRGVEAELATFAADQRRFEALQDVCAALERLDELEAGALFWDGLPVGEGPAAHLRQVRNGIARFEGEIRGTREKQESLQAQIRRHQDHLDYLHDEVRQAYARDERRKDELVVEREASPLPFRRMVMPWSNEGESEKRFRRALLVALLLSLCLGYLIPLVTVPKPDRSAVVEIPERLAMLVKKEPPKPEPVPERPKEEKKPEVEPEKPTQTAQEKPQPTPAETQAARKKAESTGVLAFKNTFADLIDETPVAKLGAEARLSNEAAAAGQARAQRSLVAMQAQGGSSGGISNAAVSRNVGSGNADRLGGVGFARVESAVAGLAEEARPLSDGPGPARTDEEIQIVFDRYKATLYRIYNTELRKNPTLRGKLLLRITIEPGGEVSACTVESTDLASPELVAQIVDRVLRFNFGPKEKVPKTVILYPIDFLPAG